MTKMSEEERDKSFRQLGHAITFAYWLVMGVAMLFVSFPIFMAIKYYLTK